MAYPGRTPLPTPSLVQGKPWECGSAARIGVKTWRRLHRFTLLVYVLALGHVVGASTDGRATWMLALLTILTAPIVFAFTYRMLPAPPRTPAARARPARPAEALVGGGA